MTGDLKFNDKVFVGSGAPVTDDEITANTNYGIGTLYVDKTNGTQYVRTGVNKVTGDWTQIGGGSSYLVYVALLTQTSTNAPVATVLQNTLGGTVVWTREDVGYYVGTLEGVFTVGKTWVSLTKYNTEVSVGSSGNWNVNNVEILQTDLSELNTPLDGMSKTSIEIRVYP